MKIGIVWFRQDLRLHDNPALVAACKNCDAVVPVFIDDPTKQTCSSLGSASRVWLHASLQSLQQSLEQYNQHLFLMQGDALDCLQRLICATGASDVFWNRCYDPVTIKRDKTIKSSLSPTLEVHSSNGLLIREPWQNTKDDGTAYRVYTPYWRKLAKDLPADKPLAKPRQMPFPASKDASLAALRKCSLESLSLLPSENWHLSMMSHWKPGETAARKQLAAFIKNAVNDYGEARNLPAVTGTSKLSPHLHFGELSPRQVMHELYNKCDDVVSDNSGAQVYAKEIVWREFAYHLIFHFPKTVNQPLDRRFENFPWSRQYGKQLRAWQQGRTGVPIVDAGMRELWHTGWMHNRVRMIVASYLVKNLLIPWQKGEQWFRDTLVDADIASNAMGWQWTAGSGADAAPYFRVFNPVLQGEKFDKSGDYVRQWVPELSKVENRYLHKPWESDNALLAAPDYPKPLVDLKESRVRALAAFDQIKAPQGS